jgi:PTH1 family peptidyl-tRNA hydrolase
MKFLIVGLGNIGDEYAGTRHNIGFDVIDKVASLTGVGFSNARYADVAMAKHKGRQYVLVKPTTYVNLSGNSVRYWMQQEKITVENIFVVTDELALPFGKIRIRGKGSDGGHNGLKHIQETIQTQNYARLRFGIGSDFAKGHQVDFVLGKWNAEEQIKLNERLQIAAEACLQFGLMGLNFTMNTFNNK